MNEQKVSMNPFDAPQDEEELDSVRSMYHMGT